MTRRAPGASPGLGLALGLLLAVAAPAAIAQQQAAPSWVEPAYPTTPPEDKVLTAVNIYNYEERAFAPPVVVQAVPSEAFTMATPEQAAISRFSAMMAGDYEAVMAMWDEASRDLTLARDTANGRDESTYQALWTWLFGLSRATLLRRIDTGAYVIVTYKYMKDDGTPFEDIEFPMIFRKFGEEWRPTQELARDDLPELSPWVSGETEVERIVR